jgi:HK97 family phage portal protein
MRIEFADGKLQHFEIKSLGIAIRRTKAPAGLVGISESQALSWWWPIVREASPGAWQRNEEIRLDNALTNPTVYACTTLIPSDVAKMRPRLMGRDSDGVWTEFENTAHSPVLRKPNHFQTWFQFAQWWMTSKLTHGNTYVLKRRDNRRVVNGLFILDPTRVKLLQAPDGSYFYELSPSNVDALGLPANEKTVVVPASEIIHDVCCPLFHPKMGVSPIFAAGYAALMSRYILNNARKLHENGSSPGGVLSGPGQISQPTADRLKTYFETEFAGDNYGKVAVLGDGLTYTPMGIATAVDSQVIEILKWTDEQVAKCYHMPLFKVGGPLPPYSSVEAVTQLYYSDCLQGHVTPFEQVLSEGMELPLNTAIMLDIDDLNRMDSATAMEIAVNGVRGGILTPNEGRRRFDRKRLKGGDTVYMQHQDYSISVLADRDAQGAAGAGLTPQAPTPAPSEPEPAAVKQARWLFMAKAYEVGGRNRAKEKAAA